MPENNISPSVEKQHLLQLCSEKGPCTIEDDVFEQCAVFLFYTSWFEERLFNKSKKQNPKNDREICTELTSLLMLNKYDSFGVYFRERYIDSNGDLKEHFNNLGLSTSDTADVQTSLKNFSPGEFYPPELLWAYLQIVYRYRNNMFHGNKHLANLREFVGEFKVINRFMHQFISDIIDSDYKGFNI